MGVTLQFIQSNVETSVMVESSSVAQATPSRGVAAAGVIEESEKKAGQQMPKITSPHYTTQDTPLNIGQSSCAILGFSV